MELRMYASDDGFAEVAMVADWIAKLTNPCLFVDLRDLPEVERLVYLHDLKEWFEQLTH